MKDYKKYLTVLLAFLLAVSVFINISSACECESPDDECEAIPKPGQSGCCGCGTLGSQCVVCDTGCTCESKSNAKGTAKCIKK